MADETTQLQSTWQVVVTPRTRDVDAAGREFLGDVRRAGWGHLRDIRASTVYFLAGELDEDDVQRIAAELLADPVTEHRTCAPGMTRRETDGPAVEVHYQPGVMDPFALSTNEAFRELL